MCSSDVVYGAENIFILLHLLVLDSKSLMKSKLFSSETPNYLISSKLISKACL